MMRKLLFSLLLIFGANAVFAQGGTVCVEIFNDINGNGTLEESEPGIAEIPVYVIVAPDSFPNPLPCGASTSVNGLFCFTGLPYGQYTFMIEVPEGWVFEGNPYFTVDITEENPGDSNAFRFGLADDPLNNISFRKNELSLYPNPASDNINLMGYDAGCTLTIYSMSGTLLHSQLLTTSDEASVSVSDLAAGMYIAQIISAGQTNTLRFVVK